MDDRTLRNIMLNAAIALLAIVLVSCSGQRHDGADPVSRQLRALMEASVPSGEKTGILLGVWSPRKGEWVLATGLANIPAGRSLAPGDYWQAASITKTFTGTILLQLVDEGLLSLDDPITDYCRPAVPASRIPAIPHGDQITVRRLLSHTTGIVDYGSIWWIVEAFLADPARVWSPEEIVQAALDKGPSFLPGAQFEYSNTNTFILGMLIEQLTGRTIKEELQARIFTPLGLTTTFFPTTPFADGALARGYVQLGGQLTDFTDFSPSFPWAAGAIISTLSDMKMYIEALVGGRLLGQATQWERMNWWEAKSAGFWGEGYASSRYGLHLMSYDGFIGHSGDSIGFATMAVANPTTGDTIVFMANSGSFDHNLFLKKVIQIVFPETSP